MQTEKSELRHVSQINWADDTIHRAAIIPFYTKQNKDMMGLGIRDNTAVIVTIGGSFEKDDIDLFSTAVREYNEETGSNITENDVADCFALLNKGTVTILLPVNDRVNFVSLQEISRVIWITTNQLRIILNNLDYDVSNNNHKTHLLTLSQSLINESSSIIEAINTGIPLLRTSKYFIYRRVKKIPETKGVRVSTNYQQLQYDMNDPSLFYGAGALVMRGNYISFQRRDGVVYAFTIDKYNDFVDFIKRNNIKINVGFIYEAKKYDEIFGLRKCYSIEGRILRLLKTSSDKQKIQLNDIWNNFRNRISLYKKSPDYLSTTWEVILIYETEQKLYDLTPDGNLMFNGPRTCFIEALDLTNQYIINNNYVTVNQLYDYLFENRTFGYITVDHIIEIMIELKLIVVDDNIVTII